MKKLMLAFVLLLGVVVSVKAQSIYGDKVKTDVKMKYIYSFEEALKKAREVNKPIFVNCFADWAVPCHGMNQLVFSDQQFADWMDRHFVNLFIDITTNEGRPLATKYNTLQMAHYIVLDQDGNLIYRIVGGHQLPEFQELLAKALDPKTTLPEMNRRYEKGERNLKFLRAYADVLNTASEDEKAKKVIEDIFARLKDKQLPKEENWKYFMQKIRTNEDELFKKLITRKAVPGLKKRRCLQLLQLPQRPVHRLVHRLKCVGLTAQIEIRRAVQPGFDGFCPIGKFLLIHRDRLLSALFCLLDGDTPRFVLTKRNLFRKNRRGFCPAGCYACTYALGCAFW